MSTVVGAAASSVIGDPMSKSQNSQSSQQQLSQTNLGDDDASVAVGSKRKRRNAVIDDDDDDDDGNVDDVNVDDVSPEVFETAKSPKAAPDTAQTQVAVAVATEKKAAAAGDDEDDMVADDDDDGAADLLDGGPEAGAGDGVFAQFRGQSGDIVCATLADGTGDLETLLDIVGACMDTAQFSFVRTNNFEGIVIYSANTTSSCVCRGRVPLSIKNFVPDEGKKRIQFCVDVSIMLRLIKTMQGGNPLRIDVFEKDEFELNFTSYDVTTQSQFSKAKMKTRDDSAVQEISFSGRKFPHKVEISLTNLRRFLVAASQAEAREVQLKILESRTERSDGRIHAQTYFVMSFATDMFSMENMFPSSSIIEKDEDGPQVIMASNAVPVDFDVASAKCNEVFSAEFNTKIFLSIAKNMPNSVVRLELGNQLPMLMNYGYGANACLYFLLAQSIEED
jgi:hypothetical protein